MALRSHFASFHLVPRALAVSLLLVAACGGDSPGADFRIESHDGISHSVAPDAPEQGEHELELLWEAPSSAERLEGSRWANPTQLAADASGVAVLDPQLSQVHIFTRDGERTGSLGRSGDGPGELAQGISIALHGDTVVVHDFSRPALQLFTRGGDYLGGFATTEGVSFGFYYLAGAGVLRSSLLPASGQPEQQWMFSGFDGAEAPFRLPADHPLQPHVAEGEAGCWRRATAGAYLLELDCTFPLARIVDRTGEVVREHRIDRLPEPASPEALEALRELMAERMGASAGAVPPAMVRRMVDQQTERNRWLQAMRGIAGSPSGDRIVLWEQLSGDLGGGDATLHILDGEGRYLFRAPLGVPLTALAVAEDRIYALAPDPETDLKTLQAFVLP